MPKFTRLQRLSFDDERPEFDCGDSDLNEFFSSDSIESDKQLLSVTYLAKDEADNGIAFLSLSNDSIKKELLPSKNAFKRLVRSLSRSKRYSSMPAVKIGRLGTRSDLQGNGIGTDLLDYIKFWFTHGNKTGCKFILVDAYNNPRTIKFYIDNGFNFLISSGEKDETRLMYFDLITFRP